VRSSRALRIFIAALGAIYLSALRLRVLRGVPRACRLAIYQILRWRHHVLTRGALASDALERHKRFLTQSSSYRTFHASANPMSSAVTADRVRIAGLVWSVPLDDRKPGSLSDRLLHRELPIAEILRTRSFARGGVMIDIGANIGTTAIPRVLLGDVECVYGAEPDPANYDCLMRTVAENQLDGYVFADRVALGATDGDANLLVASRLGRHRLLPSDRTSRSVIRVPCLMLDTWSERLGPDLDRVTYVKCDTQGWEAHVVAGAPRVLARKTIIWEMEICPRLLEAAGSSLDALCTVLTREFRWFVDLRAEHGRLERWPIDSLEKTVRAAVEGPRNYTNVILGNAS
jgi:FkbM family methyltransferase